MQNYYKIRNSEVYKSASEEKIKELVQSERKVLSRIGIRKLHYKLRDEIIAQEIKCGRDKLSSTNFGRYKRSFNINLFYNLVKAFDLDILI